MRITTISNQPGLVKSNLKLQTFIAALCCIVIFSTKTYAQTNPYVTVGTSKLVCTTGSAACPANDLQVQDMFVEGVESCLTCDPGSTVTKKLYMRIFNSTGSVRTAFALFGNLSNGASIEGKTGKIFICVGPIDILKGLNTFEVGMISFTCGTQVTLTDNYLAYTPANSTTQAACATFSNATTCKDISPKCGVAAVINIRTPGSASVTSFTKPCEGASTGSFTISPVNGKAPYTVSVFNKTTTTCPATIPAGPSVKTQSAIAANGTCVVSNVAAGDYCIYVTDDNNCTFKFAYTLASKVCCTPPGAPTVCQVPAELCGDGKIVLKVSGTVKDAAYHVKQGGTEVTGSPKTATANGDVLEFKVVPGGGDVEVYGVSFGEGDQECKGTSTSTDCANKVSFPICPAEEATVTLRQQPTTVVLETAQPTVKAYPNPFNDRVKFVVNSSFAGNGSLEIYNMQGQKLKTVYQGHINPGDQTFELSLPKKQQTPIIYMLRVGSKQVTGKLLQLN